MEDSPVCNVDDNLLIEYPLEDKSLATFTATVLKIKKKKIEKNGSLYKYTLQLSSSGKSNEDDNDDTNMIVETRLLHLKYKILTSIDISASLSSRNKEEKRKLFADCNPKSTKKSKKSEGANSSGNNDSNEGYPMPNCKYILAPMVGGSELAFRLLCRRYAVTLAYTPMMSSDRFCVDEEYRKQEFQTTSEDRPLVAHFSANDPSTLLKAAKLVQDKCDAIDLNLGCPQRIAHAGHFGSYLLGDEDRPLVLNIVRTVASNIHIPMFVKIRLLNTVTETIEFCKQLADAGAALIAIHARYRVNLVGRTGPGARDGM